MKPVKMSRYYQPQPFEIGQTVSLSKENHRHAVQVLRSTVGDPLILFNGQGGEYQARFTKINKRDSQAMIESFIHAERESCLRITLVMAMIKPEKMDFAIQKAVELGVDAIQPIYTRRSVIRLKAQRLEKKLLHWQGVIISASEQSGRTRLASIESPIELDKWLDATDMEHGFVMLPGEYPGFMQVDTGQDGLTELALMIGPEGGFSDEEEKQLIAHKITPLSAGPRVLRAETAAIAGISACQLRWGDF